MNAQPHRGKTTPASTSGSFKTHAHGAGDVDLVDDGYDVAAMDPRLATMAPSDIDAELYDLYARHQQAQSRAASMAEFVAGEIGRRVYRRGFRGSASAAEVSETIAAWRAQPEAERSPDARDILRRQDEVDKHLAQARAVEREMEPYDHEFARRGGWTRAFLVSNGDGHVHSSMSCSTCRPTTQYHWVTELSDHDEAEIVEAAGERACTVCYPSAPVDVLRRPTTLFTPDEIEKAKAREEREAAKAERERNRLEKALMPDGSPLRVGTNGGRSYGDSLKTVATAKQWVVSGMCWKAAREGEDHPSYTAEDTSTVIEAIAAKEGRPDEEIRAELQAKADAKIRKGTW